MNLQTRAINYALIARALEHYQTHGFQYVEVPWYVRPEVGNITKPPRKRNYEISLGALIGSGEQGFMQMYLDGKIRSRHLGNNKYVTATPCFRDDREDATHHKTFFKVELFIPGMLNSPLQGDSGSFLAHTAMQCFIELGLLEPRLTETKSGFDIMSRDKLELGSYGVRKYFEPGAPKFYEYSWAFGTGLAEPRFSMALNQQQQKRDAK